MTKILYIPTGDFLNFISETPDLSLTTTVFEEAVMGTLTPDDFIDLTISFQQLMNFTNDVHLPILREELEIIYD